MTLLLAGEGHLSGVHLLEDPYKPVDLAEFYKFFRWHSRPDDPEARARFDAIKGFMKGLISRGILDEAIGSGKARVLDVMGASGIAGIALAWALNSSGVEAEVMVTDLRDGELGMADEWLRMARLENSVRLETLRANATRLPEDLGGREFDIVVLWGSSLPHLDVYDLHLFLAGARELQPRHGVILMEQFSLLPRILVYNMFKHILVEGDALTLFREYDDSRGVQRRLVYALPELRYMGMIEARLWETSQVMATAWIYYRRVETLDYTEGKRSSKVIVARNPRGQAPSWRELFETHPLRNSGRISR